MSSIDDNALKFLKGIPLMFKDICLIYSPTLGEIASSGLSKFYQYMSLLLIERDLSEDSEEQANILKSLSDFEYLLFLSSLDADMHKNVKDAFRFFTHEDVLLSMTPPSVIFGDVSEKRILMNENFPEFQELISQCCAASDVNEERIVVYDTDDDHTKRIKYQLIEGRKKREKAKRKASSNNEKNALRFSDLLASLCIGSNGAINMLNIWDLTYYSFQDQIKRMSWKEEFDINTRAALAGAKMDKQKLSYWIKNMTFK